MAASDGFNPRTEATPGSVTSMLLKFALGAGGATFLTGFVICPIPVLSACVAQVF